MNQNIKPTRGIRKGRQITNLKILPDGAGFGDPPRSKHTLFGHLARRHKGHQHIRNAQELEAAINDYFTACKTENRPYTLGGLAVYLGTTTAVLSALSFRQRYAKILKKSIEILYAFAQEQLFNKQANTLGIVTYLNNVFGWKSQLSIEAGREKVSGFKYVVPSKPKPKRSKGEETSGEMEEGGGVGEIDEENGGYLLPSPPPPAQKDA